MLSHSLVLALSTALASVAAGRVCTPSGCISGTSSSQLLAVDSANDLYLTPGTYRVNNASPKSRVNATIWTTSTSVEVQPPSQPVTFPLATYEGSPVLRDLNVSIGTEQWQSLYLPQGWYALLDPGRALWGAIPDRGQLSLKTYSISTFGSTLCTPSCASNGVCTPTLDNTNATCVCAPGWTGAACDQCLPGHFGPTCTACPSNCSTCDEGVLGTGVCRSPTGSEACDCAHGSCLASGGCKCAAGWTTDAGVSEQKCNTCMSGFFEDVNHNCIACPVGCTACELLEGTDSTPKCTACQPRLILSTDVAAKCREEVPCPKRQYFDTNARDCKPCSPACSTCTGPTSADCIACASVRSRLRQDCVNFDSLSGVCDSAFTGINGTYVVRNEKQACDACPVGCLDCHIPSWNIASKWSELTCTSCQDGYVLQNGACRRECASGTYFPQTAISNATCKACDASCATCLGTPTFCTSCKSGVAFNGTCVATCPPSTVGVDGQCQACHPDCATCSVGGSASACLTCSPSHPVLANGRCVEYCQKGSYFDRGNASCKPCGAGCAACLSSDKCALCDDGFTLSGGMCGPAACTGPFATGLGLCLTALVEGGQSTPDVLTTTEPHGSLLWFIGVFLGSAVVVAGVVWWIRRERARTRAATAAFGQRIEQANLRRRLTQLLGTLALRRRSTDANANAGTEQPPERQQRGRGRIPSFWAKPARPNTHSPSTRPTTPPPANIIPPAAPVTPPKGQYELEEWQTPPPAYSAVAYQYPNDDELVHAPLSPTLPARSLPPPPRRMPSVDTLDGRRGGIRLSPVAATELADLSSMGRRGRDSMV